MKPDQKAAITSAQKDGLSLTKRNALNKEAGSDLESAEGMFQCLFVVYQFNDTPFF